MAKKSDKLTNAFPKNIYPGVLETDTAKNSAADKAIKAVLKSEDGELPEALIAKAGQRALANRHFITFMGYKDEDGESFQLTGSSLAYTQKNFEYDEVTTLLCSLLPEGIEEAASLTWQYSTPKSLEDAVRELREIGFMWDEADQRQTDKTCGVKLADRIKAIYTEVPAPKYIGLLETDSKKNAAADKIMADIADGEEPDEVDDALLKALANRHTFFLQHWEDNDTFTITAGSIAQNEGDCDFSVGARLTKGLIPVNIEELSTACWACEDDMSVTKVAKAMRNAGFLWSEKEQRIMEERYADEIAKVYKETSPKAAAKPTKPKH